MDQSQELRRVGLKVTHPRVRILSILQGRHPRHFSAEDIYRHLVEHSEDIGLATVYRVLTQFEAAGIVNKHHFESGQAVFELNRGSHHDHMIDLDSGKVIEFVDEDIERLQRAIAQRHGYDLEEHSLVLYVRPRRAARAAPETAVPGRTPARSASAKSSASVKKVTPAQGGRQSR